MSLSHTITTASLFTAKQSATIFTRRRCTGALWHLLCSNLAGHGTGNKDIGCLKSASTSFQTDSIPQNNQSPSHIQNVYKWLLIWNLWKLPNQFTIHFHLCLRFGFSLSRFHRRQMRQDVALHLMGTGEADVSSSPHSSARKMHFRTSNTTET